MATTATVTAAQFKSRFPELGPLSDVEITAYITLACELSSVSKTAILYLAAHLYILDKHESGDKIDGGSGEVSSETMNRKVYMYKTMAESNRDVFFTRTMYGRSFLAFEKRSPARTLGMFSA